MGCPHGRWDPEYCRICNDIQLGDLFGIPTDAMSTNENSVLEIKGIRPPVPLLTPEMFMAVVPVLTPEEENGEVKGAVDEHLLQDNAQVP